MRRSQRKPYFYRGTALGAAVLLALVGCTSADGKGSGEATATPPVVEEPEETAPVPEPVGTWPLTGVSVYGLPSGDLVDESGKPLEFDDAADGAGSADAGGIVDVASLLEALAAPALSIKIENSAASRPQDGLERADIVWEQLVEGGMTRFVAMFHSDIPETVGPIRSIRPMDAAIAGPVGGIFAFSGGQPDYKQRIQQAGLLTLDNDAGSGGFYRNPTRRGDHTLFGYPKLFLEAGADRDAPPELFSFAADEQVPTAVAAGEAAGGVDISFPASKPSWKWNGGVWERLESGNLANSESGVRLSADNVVVAFVQIRDTGKTDSAGSMVPETILTGEGKATVFTGGHAIEVVWEKGGVADPLILRTSDGAPVLLAPGKTWVELVPASSGRISIH